MPIAIEPLWDWNVLYVGYQGQVEVRLQSNHYGIEIRVDDLEEIEVLGCNRTIMGLKLSYFALHSALHSALQSNHYGIEMLQVMR